MILRVNLRDGFRDDIVTIISNGENVYHKSGVTTDQSSSCADAIDIPVKEATINLEVSIESGQKIMKTIRVQETPFVNIWNDNGKLSLKASKDEHEFPML